MKTELKRCPPAAQGVPAEYIINFLNACEKADSEIHGIMIARNGQVIFEAYTVERCVPPTPPIFPILCTRSPKHSPTRRWPCPGPTAS